MIPKKTKTGLILFAYSMILLFFSGLSLYFANAIPEGATISGTPSVDTGPTRNPGSSQVPGGRIVTLDLSLEQQDFSWKAYIGNVSGSYVLKNSLNFSIYEWPLGTSIAGEVYLSRSASVNFSYGAIACASAANMSTEQAVFGMSSSAPDNINNTFNSTNHTGFNAGQNVIAKDTCPAIALWVNDTVQTPLSTAVFQEVALRDNLGNFIFASIINNDQTGFDNTTKFDFQAIVAENSSSSSGTNYYFYLELVS